MPTSFTQEQRAFIRQVVFEAAPAILETHVESCPWGKRLRRTFWVALGIGAGIGLTGGSVAWGVVIKILAP